MSKLIKLREKHLGGGNIMSNLVVLLLKLSGAIFAGFLAGHGAVYIFNKIPAAWLCDYGAVSYTHLDVYKRQKYVRDWQWWKENYKQGKTEWMQ